jgi:diaminohydroxyphosphoribosylaminopyrimidine deaminase/5-amino-6-(5-phosphoribosylamino)uracil reductase
MKHAFDLARSGLGRTAPNPSVGCVLVKFGQIVGEGRTQSGGRPHGEAMALMRAGALARGADAYVTLEPCAHESLRGPSCSDSLIQAGLNSVTISVLDPDPRTAGKGVHKLQSWGLGVRVGLLEEDGKKQISGFEKRIRLGLPWVHVGRDDGSFDLAITEAPLMSWQDYLRQLAGSGCMRVCVSTALYADWPAVDRGLIDSCDEG